MASAKLATSMMVAKIVNGTAADSVVKPHSAEAVGAPTGAMPTMAPSLFFAALAFATAVPLVGLGLGVGVLNPNAAHSPILLGAMIPVIAATGVGHVASTAYLYIDQDFRQLIRQNWARFFLWPMLAIAVSFGAFTLSPLTAGLSNTLFFIWQLYHFQRQNYGIIAFVAHHRRLGPVPKTLPVVLNLSLAGGVFTMLSGPWFLHTRVLQLAGIAAFAGATAALAFVTVVNRRIATDPLVMLFTVLGWAFFLPTLLSRDLLVAFTSYAISHGAQYLIFLFVISSGSRFKTLGPVVMAGSAYVTWLFLSPMLSTPSGTAIYSGIVIGHFMVDAKIWRMRERLSRSLIQQRFKFLFA